MAKPIHGGGKRTGILSENSSSLQHLLFNQRSIKIICTREEMTGKDWCFTAFSTIDIATAAGCFHLNKTKK
jgi:hypothetical protein